MEKRRLGRSDIEISSLGIGTWSSIQPASEPKGQTFDAVMKNLQQQLAERSGTGGQTETEEVQRGQ